MKKPLPLFLACTLLVLTAAGCDKTSAPLPELATSSPRISVPTVPEMPNPTVPKGAQAPTPLPGQANDHSSPAFKGGGATDPQK